MKTNTEKAAILSGKRIYAFGDSVVYGHTAPEKSFMRIIADEYGIDLGMYAVNGATVISLDSLEKEASDELKVGNYIINQVKAAPDTAPELVIFNGATNDSYGSPLTDSHNPRNAHIDVMKHLGVIQGADATQFDNASFCGGFEEILFNMRKKWGDVPIAYVTVHKSSARDWGVQCKLRELVLEMCAAWNVQVIDMFKDSPLDTRDEEQCAKYIMGGAGSHPNEAGCREFYVPFVSDAISDILA